jgi:3-vinyl bacteriochlorophyllide hydratase
MVKPLYTPEQRRRRDASPWTFVQGVLAPLQFVVFLVSLGLVLRFLATGSGADAAAWSVFAKTFVLYTIMVTGAVWEHEVFGQYLFADAFFWEDVVSFAVIAGHTLSVAAWWFGWFDARTQLVIALAAYALYVVNAGQFLWKLRQARLQERAERQTHLGGVALEAAR